MSIFSFLSSPIAFAAVTVAAIGVIVYQIINQQNEERVHANGRNNRRPRSNTGTSSTSCRTFESDVRRRRPDENNPTPNSSNVLKHKSEVTLDETDPKKSNFNEEQYRQNVFDKIEKDVKNFNQKDENAKLFDKNIDVSNDNATDDSENLDETKVINLNVSNANVANTIPGSSSDVTKKENSQETKFPNSNSSISGSDVAGTSNQDMASSKCKACEEVPANAVAYPCNHCYLCANCATMVFRIYKKCTICDSSVDSFQILTS